MVGILECHFFVPLACRGQDQLFLNGVVEVGLLTNVV